MRLPRLDFISSHKNNRPETPFRPVIILYNIESFHYAEEARGITIKPPSITVCVLPYPRFRAVIFIEISENHLIRRIGAKIRFDYDHRVTHPDIAF